MGFREFCPRCGSEKGPFIKGFCKNCFEEKSSPVSIPSEIVLEECRKCGKVRLGRFWKKFSLDEATGFLEKKIKTRDVLSPKTKIVLEEKSDSEFIAGVEVSGKIGLQKTVFSSKVLLKKRGAVCDSCSRVFGNYFEAIIQLRFEKKSGEVEKKIESVELLLEEIEKKDALAKIVKIVSERNGADLYIGSNSGAKKVVTAMQKSATQKVVATTSLQGFDRQKGKKRYRYTYCLRF